MGQENATVPADAIQVRFLGNFQICIGDVVVNKTASRARRPWNLLQYLMVHRNKTVTRQQLIEALWPDETSEQPDKALKNLVYRVRTAFAAKNIPYAQEVVLYHAGNYHLNNDLPWVFDFEQAEAYFEQARAPGLTADEKVKLDLKAIELYRGDFLAEQVYEDWVLPYNTYYRSQFFKCVNYTLNVLIAEGHNETIEFVCNRAIEIDPFEESLHLAYMNALVSQGKKSTALAHYNKLADMFFREMGVTPCEELRELYHELSNQLNRLETDLLSIKNVLSEPEVNNDAFYCDFEVFRSLYRLEARSAERAGQAIFVGLLTLSGEGGDPPEGEALTKSMAALLKAQHQCLRRGDVISRFSMCQYILMLPTLTVENADRVMGRIEEKFAKQNPFGQITLEAKIQPLDPVMD
jgi:DNA-binding SARP family transcriptional activator